MPGREPTPGVRTASTSCPVRSASSLRLRGRQQQAARPRSSAAQPSTPIAGLQAGAVGDHDGSGALAAGAAIAAHSASRSTSRPCSSATPHSSQRSITRSDCASAASGHADRGLADRRRQRDPAVKRLAAERAGIRLTHAVFGGRELVAQPRAGERVEKVARVERLRGRQRPLSGRSRGARSATHPRPSITRGEPVHVRCRAPPRAGRLDPARASQTILNRARRRASRSGPPAGGRPRASPRVSRRAQGELKRQRPAPRARAEPVMGDHGRGGQQRAHVAVSTWRGTVICSPAG